MRLYLLLLLFITVFVPTKAKAGFIDYPTVKLQALDKSTARTITFEAKVGSTIEYGSVFIKVKACRKSEPLDKPENASFIQVWEVPINSDKSEWIFSGWMFSSSPALSAMNHPVYDVWVLGCIDKDNEVKQAEVAQPEGEVATDDANTDTDEDTSVINDTDDDQMTIEMDGEATAAAAQQKPIDDIVDEIIQSDENDDMTIEIEEVEDSEAELDEGVSFAE